MKSSFLALALAFVSTVTFAQQKIPEGASTVYFVGRIKEVSKVSEPIFPSPGKPYRTVFITVPLDGSDDKTGGASYKVVVDPKDETKATIYFSAVAFNVKRAEILLVEKVVKHEVRIPESVTSVKVVNLAEGTGGLVEAPRK